METHNCVKIEPRATDYVLGANSPIPFRAVSSGIWTSNLEFFENQDLGWETDGCVLFTAQESFDAQMDNLIGLGEIPKNIIAQFVSMGYMDLGFDGLPHFHSSARFLQILTGNGMNGNNLYDAWDVMREYGVLPWKDLPYDKTITQAEYFTKPTPAQFAKAAQFLALIGGKNAIPYHWVINGTPKDLVVMQKALQQAPLCLGIAVGQPWNQITPANPAPTAPPQHSVMTYLIESPNNSILDHYPPYEKILDGGYSINYVMQGILSPIFTSVPIPSPVIQPTQANVDILTKIVAIYQKILLLIKGRNLTSTMTDYNSWISKTNWTLVATVLINVINAFFPIIPVSYQAGITTALGLLAGYFHVTGVNRAAIASASAGVPLSGQK